MQAENTYKKNKLLNFLEKEKIRVITLIFTDVLGIPKGVEIPVTEMENILEDGANFDGSSIEGFARIEESDLRLIPYEESIRKYETNGELTGFIFCKIEKPNGQRLDKDSFFVLEKQMEKAKKMGFDKLYTGPELEFFILKKSVLNNLNDISDCSDLKNEIAANIINNEQYFNIDRDYSTGWGLRRKIINTCQKMNIPVEYSHHEVSSGQNEIDLKYTDAIEMSMRAILYRWVVKDIAKKSGYYVTFMPKIIKEISGNGMHVHQSLTKNGKNVFYKKSDKYKLSDIAKKYIAGILKHAPEIIAVTNQWVNSYQRLVPGYEAPTELCWGTRNRSLAVRVPEFRNKESARVEVRFPDPACNIPLTFALMLACGLEGIKKNYELPSAVEENVYEMSKQEKEKRNILSLPENLKKATKIMKKSKLIKKILGEELHKTILRNRKLQWKRYSMEVPDKHIINHNVTAYEIKELLPVL